MQDTSLYQYLFDPKSPSASAAWTSMSKDSAWTSGPSMHEGGLDLYPC